MGKGSAQEEIWFISHPELLAALLVCEALQDNEAILAIGILKSSDYSGYSDTFKYVGKAHIELPAKDKDDRFKTMLVAIDALKFEKEGSIEEWRIDRVIRELVKACSGFQKTPELFEYLDWKVVTGKWGCGVFNGDKLLKFLIQWLAATACGRKLVFTTLMDSDFRYINRVIRKIQNKKFNEVFLILVTFCKAALKFPEIEQSLFDVLTQEETETKDAGIVEDKKTEETIQEN